MGLAGLNRAVERIADAIDRGQRIGVFGDYDVDGVTTAALLTTFLRATGAEVEVHATLAYGETIAQAPMLIDGKSCPLTSAETLEDQTIHLALAEREQLEEWVSDYLTLEAKARAGDPGKVVLRRR